MAAHRGESYGFAPQSGSAPSSHRRILGILVLTGMLTIGFVGAVFTGSYLMGIVFAALTGACIVLANLMIAPGSISGSDVVPDNDAANRPASHRVRKGVHLLGGRT